MVGSGSFGDDSLFQKCRDNAFQIFMNECSQTAFYLAAYCDNDLRKGLKALSDEEVESKLDSIIRLFCFLHERDSFLKSYQKHLANRLLNKTFLAMENEESVLKKLQIECGLNQVNKMQQMFKDMQISKDYIAEFKKQKGNEI